MEAPYNEVLDLLWYICNWFALSTNNCIDVFKSGSMNFSKVSM